MANPIVRVILKGVDEVTDVGQKAASGISTAFKALGAAIAGVAIGEFFRRAIDEAAKAEQGMVRLGLAVTNSGADFRKMQPEIEKAVQGLVRMTTATDDDLRAALTKMTTVSSDAKGSLANLGLAADVAAYKHISLEEAGTLVGKAMTGNTKVLKEFGITATDVANPMEVLTQKVGGFAEKEGASFSGTLTRIKNNFGEVLEAIGSTILSGGELQGAGSGLVDMLGNLAVWIEKNEEQFRPFITAIVNAFGAVWDLAGVLKDALAPALGPLLRVAGGAALLVLNELKAAVLVVGATFAKMASVALSALGAIVEKGGSLLKVFGVTVVKEYGAKITESAKQLEATANDLASKAKEAAVQGWKDTFSAHTVHAAKTTGLADDTERKVTHIVTSGNAARLKEVKKARDEEIEIAYKHAAAMQKTTEIIYDALKRLEKGALKGQKEEWAEIARIAAEHARTIVDLLPPASELAASIEDGRITTEKILEADKKRRDLYAQHVAEAGQFATGLIDAASAMGKLDAHAANSLKTVVNMGTSIATMLGSGFTTGGMIGLIGGLASLIGGWANNPAEKRRMEVMQANIAALEKNTDVISLGATGRTIQGTGDAIAAAVAAADRARPRNALEGASAAISARELLFQDFARRGVSRTDAMQLLKDLGIEGLDSNDWETFKNALHSAQKALEKIQPGFGTTWAGQIKGVQEGFGIFGTEDPDAKLRQLTDVAKKFNTGALGEALGAGSLETGEGRTAITKALQGLFARMLSGEKIATGDLTGAQLLDFIKLVLPLLSGADGVLPAGVLPTIPGTGGTSALLGSMTGATTTGVVGGASGIGGVTVNGGVQVTVSFGGVAKGEDAGEVVDALLEEVDRRYKLRLQAMGQSAARDI